MSIDKLINKYLNEAENFTPFQRRLIADYVNQVSCKITNSKEALNAQLYMWRLGGKNKETDAELLKQLEELIKKGYMEIKNGEFGLTSKGRNTEISKQIGAHIASYYGKGKYNGD